MQPIKVQMVCQCNWLPGVLDDTIQHQTMEEKNWSNITKHEQAKKQHGCLHIHWSCQSLQISLATAHTYSCTTSWAYWTRPFPLDTTAWSSISRNESNNHCRCNERFPWLLASISHLHWCLARSNFRWFKIVDFENKCPSVNCFFDQILCRLW